MGRYSRIESVTFGQTSLPLPLSVRLSRRTEAMPSASNNDIFVTSVQVDPVMVAAEVRFRDTSAAEGLSLGQQGDLSFTTGPTQSGQAPREITLAGAVLVAVDLMYEQGAVATATAKFVAEADSGSADPFSSEEVE